MQRWLALVDLKVDAMYAGSSGTKEQSALKRIEVPQAQVDLQGSVTTVE